MSDKHDQELEEQAKASQEEETDKVDAEQSSIDEPEVQQELPDEANQAEYRLDEQAPAKHWLATSGLPWALTGLLALVLIVLIIYTKPFDQSEAVATVNDEEISMEQMHEAVVAQIGPQGVDQVIEQLITEAFIRQTASDAGVEVTEEDLDAELAKVREQFPSEQQFQDTLEQVGLTEAMVKEQMSTQVLLDKMLASEVEVTDADISELFEQRKQELSDPEQIRASHILVESREEAEQLLADLEGGADFAALAMEHSTDGSAQQGGDLGYFGHGDMVLPFEEAAFALDKGERSDVVESQFGYHLIEVTDIPRNWTIEEKQEELKLELEQQKLGEKRTEWLADSRNDAQIEKLY